MTFHSVLYVFITSLITLFPVINPISEGLMVNGYLKGLDDAMRKKAAGKILVNCILICICSLLLGHLILLMFGLAVPVIQVGGGFVIMLTGYELLSSNDEPSVSTQPTPAQSRRADENALNMKLFYPISFPVAMGPGGISVIFTLMATSAVEDNLLHTCINYAMIALATIVILIGLYIMLVLGPRIMQKLGTSTNMIINKLVAFFIFCIGLQIIVDGVSKISHIQVL